MFSLIGNDLYYISKRNMKHRSNNKVIYLYITYVHLYFNWESFP